MSRSRPTKFTPSGQTKCYAGTPDLLSDMGRPGGGSGQDQPVGLTTIKPAMSSRTGVCIASRAGWRNPRRCWHLIDLLKLVCLWQSRKRSFLGQEKEHPLHTPSPRAPPSIKAHWSNPWIELMPSNTISRPNDWRARAKASWFIVFMNCRLTGRSQRRRLPSGQTDPSVVGPRT